MQLEKLRVSTLLSDPRNARLHDADNLKAIAASLEKFGQQKPIVVSMDNVVLAGNGTLAAAKELGWDFIQVVRSKLTGDAATAFGIADNRTAELAKWDYAQLAASVRELEEANYELITTGFSEAELQNILDMAAFTPPVLADPAVAPAPASPTTGAHKGTALRFDQAQWTKLTTALGVDEPEQVVAAVLQLLDDEPPPQTDE